MIVSVWCMGWLAGGVCVAVVCGERRGRMILTETIIRIVCHYAFLSLLRENVKVM